MVIASVYEAKGRGFDAGLRQEGMFGKFLKE